MSKIRINKHQSVEGSFSFNASIDNQSKIPILVISGVLETADDVSEITMLENERYLLTGIVIKSESYGSEEDLVAYEFLAKEYQKKGCTKHG